MIVKYDVKRSYGMVSVEGMDDLRFIPYINGVLIHNISDGENYMALDLSYRELRLLDEFIQKIKEDPIVKIRME